MKQRLTDNHGFGQKDREKWLMSDLTSGGREFLVVRSVPRAVATRFLRNGQVSLLINPVATALGTDSVVRLLSFSSDCLARMMPAAIKESYHLDLTAT
jgi:hypothetical protein